MCGIVGIVERDLESARSLPSDARSAWCGRCTIAARTKRAASRCPASASACAGWRSSTSPAGSSRFSTRPATIQIVANGEIYNFRELQHELEGRGHRFRIARSDIEVLVHAYEQWGEAFLARLRGMFALALWDGRTRTLIAARDRAGEKPLYWTQTAAGPAAGLRGQGAAGRGPRSSRELDPDGARPVPDLRVRARAAHDAQGRAQAAGRRTSSRYRDGAGDGAPLLGCGRRAGAAVDGRRGGRGAARRRCASAVAAS